jgi:hypothetical protein
MTPNWTYEEFREFVHRPGAKATITWSWMTKGCPMCGCKRWEITSDGWAYCDNCSKGFSMDSIMTNQPVEIVDFAEK